MKKIILSTIAASSLVIAANHQYEITPMIGHVQTKDHVDFENHKTFGVAVSIQRDEECKFDKLEIGLLHANDVGYDNNTLSSDINQLFANGVKEYKINDKFNLYALAGLGYEMISDEHFGNESGTFFNYGVGASYSITEDLALKLDARHQLKFDGDKNILYTLGLAIPFGENGTKTTPTAQTQESVEVTLDSDNDGVKDSLDNCPNTTAGVEVDNNGCAVVLDSDNDGVADTEDKCPTTQANIEVDTNGCAIAQEAMVESTNTNSQTNSAHILALPTEIIITFATNSTAIEDSELPQFEEYVTYLSMNKEAETIIEAHTDSLGDANYNLELSQKRANSAKKQLIDMGIEENRIEAIGYGESKPLVSNDTAENMQKNRRVTIKIK